MPSCRQLGRGEEATAGSLLHYIGVYHVYICLHFVLATWWDIPRKLHDFPNTNRWHGCQKAARWSHCWKRKRGVSPWPTRIHERILTSVLRRDDTDPRGSPSDLWIVSLPRYKRRGSTGTRWGGRHLFLYTQEDQDMSVLIRLTAQTHTHDIQIRY